MEGRGLPVAALVGGAVVSGLLVGGAVAFLASGSSEEAASIAAAPAPTVGAPSAPSKATKAQKMRPNEGESLHAFALRMAKKFRASQDESEALKYLDEALREEGPNAQVEAAKKALLAHCEQLLGSETGRVRGLLGEGKIAEARTALAALRRRLPGSFQQKLDGLTQSVQAAKPVSAKDLFAARLVKVERTAEAHFQLGQWALQRGLLAEARRCFKRAVQLDGFHAGAHQALGHRLHQGRWYSEDAYKRDVLGMVKDASGRWIKRPATLAKGTGTPVKPKPTYGGVPKPPPSPYAEDKEWYKDNTKLCDWAQAPTYASKYYLIKTNVKKEYAKKYMKMMDQYFKRFVTVFKAFLPNKRYSKSEIWIHSSRAEFRAENPRIPPTAGGYYKPSTKRVHAYHGLFGPSGTTRTVLAHEATHQFENLVLEGRFWNAPVWIIEGLAVFFESAYYNGRDVKIGMIPRDRLWSLKRGLKANKLIPLRTLLRTPQRSFGGYHYAHAWSLIYMVIYYGKSSKVRRRCQKWFSELFAMAKSKRVTDRDVIERIGGNKAFNELEERWKAWLKELPYDYNPKKGR